MPDSDAARCVAPVSHRTVARAAAQDTRGKGRHPPMPVRAVALDQSNKWSRLGQVRLSAARQTCTMLTARPLAPWVFQLGSRGNPAHCRTPQVTLEVTVHQSGYSGETQLKARAAGRSPGPLRLARACDAGGAWSPAHCRCRTCAA